MNTVERLCCAALFLVAAVPAATAQPPAGAPQRRTEVRIGGGILVGVPVGEFGSHVDSAGGDYGTVRCLPVTQHRQRWRGSVRVQPRQSRWRPYADGLFGFNYIHTTTHVEGTGSCNGTGCYSGIEATNLGDYVSSVGAGAGVVVDVGRPGGARLDASVRYLWGGEARYLTEGAIHRVGGQAVLDISRSRTDIVAIYFGVNFAP